MTAEGGFNDLRATLDGLDWRILIVVVLRTGEPIWMLSEMDVVRTAEETFLRSRTEEVGRLRRAARTWVDVSAESA